MMMMIMMTDSDYHEVRNHDEVWDGHEVKDDDEFEDDAELKKTNIFRNDHEDAVRNTDEI